MVKENNINLTGSKEEIAKALIEFEEDIAACFDNKRIKAPIHLHNGNEKELIDYFLKFVNPNDWVFSSWRSHYHCLLKGVDKGTLKEAILSGRSISLAFKEHKIFSSGIVGGNIPIAVGVAMGLKFKKVDEIVHCFVGDMTARTGIFSEGLRYSVLHNLPILFVIEDNGKSVCTDTNKTWNDLPEDVLLNYANKPQKVIRYTYTSKWPHAGSGKRIQF